MVLRLLLGKLGGKPPTPGNFSAAAPRATEARRQSKSAAPSKLSNCKVAPPANKISSFRAKRQDYLGQWTRRDFDSAATMIALAKITADPERPSLDLIFPAKLKLDRSQFQQCYKNLRTHRELNDAIDDMIGTLRRDLSLRVNPSKDPSGIIEEEAAASRTRAFLNFLEDMKEVLGGTFSAVIASKDIVLKQERRTDRDKKDVLSAALQTAWRRFAAGTNGLPADLIEEQLSQPVPMQTNGVPPARPKAAAPLTRPEISTTSSSVMSFFDREGTIQPEFKTMLKEAIGKAGMTDDAEQETLAEEILLDLNNVRAEVKRKFLDDLLKTIGDDDAEQPGKLFVVFNRIRRRANDPKARKPADGLEGVYTVQAAANVLHDLALTVLSYYPDTVLAWAAKEYLSAAQTTPAKARNFLRIAENADLAGRSLEVLNGIRNFAMPEDASPAVVPQFQGGADDPNRQDSHSDFPPLVSQQGQPVLQNPPSLHAQKSQISGSSYATRVRGRVRDDFTRFGSTDPGRLMVLFTEAAANSRSADRYSPESVQTAIAQLHALPAAVCDPLLGKLLNALGEEATGVASQPLGRAVLDEIENAARRRLSLATWKDLSQARTPEECSFIIHDIARQGPGEHWLEHFRIWGAMRLREAGISREEASGLLDLATPLPLEGRSAAVREIIRAYAEETDGAAGHRGLVLDHFIRFGTDQPERIKLLLEHAFAQSGHSFAPEFIDNLLALPSELCGHWLTKLLNALGEEKGKASQRRLDRVLESIRLAAKRPHLFATWKDLRRAKSSEQACFIIHDIARNGVDFRPENSRIGFLLLSNARVSKEAARAFMEHAEPLRLNGKSAALRDMIRAYATRPHVAALDVSPPETVQQPDRS